MLGQRAREENALVEPPFPQAARVHRNREQEVKTVWVEIAVIMSFEKEAKGGCQVQLPAVFEVEDRLAKSAGVHSTGAYGGQGAAARDG